MKLNRFALALILSGVFSLSARAEDLDFSFDTNQSDNGDPSLYGTVTGELIGVDPTGISLPTDIIITSAPSPAFGISSDYDFASNGTIAFDPSSTGVTTLDGQVVATSFIVSNGSYQLQLNTTPGEDNLLLKETQPAVDTYNIVGVGETGPSFAAAPEPSDGALFLLGFIGLFGTGLLVRKGPGLKA
jgi:hypothetical protein